MHAPATHSTTADQTTGPTHCLNCHQQLLGPHCHHCGQAASTPARITGHHLLHDIPHSIWHVDHGVLYTVREMLLRPGLSIRRYLAGERKPFYSPLTLLLLVGGISAFFFTKLHIIPFNEDQPGLSPRMLDTQRKMMEYLQRYQAWLSIFFLPIDATVATPLLRRITGYTWVEQLVAAALMSGAIAAVNLIFIPALAYWSGTPTVGLISYAMTLIMIGYKAWGYTQLQSLASNNLPHSRRPQWTRAIIVTAIQYLSILIVIITIIGVAILSR